MTRLPPDSPPAYARSQLGANALAYMRRKGWIDRRTVVHVTRIEQERKAEG